MLGGLFRGEGTEYGHRHRCEGDHKERIELLEELWLDLQRVRKASEYRIRSAPKDGSHDSAADLAGSLL